ncbi:MAG: AgmX/PglI C-terminal domain-containing protein [Sandaracinaceae bacterium]
MTGLAERAVALALALGGVATAPASAQAPPPLRNRIEGAGYALSLPTTWRPVETANPAVLGTYHAPTEGLGFTPTVNVVVEERAEDAEAYGREAADALAEVDEIEVLQVRERELDDRACVEVEARWVRPQVRYRTFQLLVARDGRGYTLTCAVGEEEAEQHRALCEGILASFRLLRSPEAMEPPPPEAVAAAPDGARGPVTIALEMTRVDGEGTYDPTPFQRTLVRRERSVRGCYRRALGAGRGVTGQLRLRLRVDVDGTVAGARTTQDSFGSARLARCVEQVMRRIQVDPAPHGGSVIYRLTLAFDRDR